MNRSRHSLRTALYLGLLWGVLMALPGVARAEGPAGDEARSAFTRGVELVRSAQWAEALTAFERASELRVHPVTTFNIGGCERAMGRYTRARRSFAAALSENEAAGNNALPASLVGDAKSFIAEIDRLLVRFTLEVAPSGSTITVDGRPLEAVRQGATTAYVAGTRPAGLGDASPQGELVVLLDPGAHVIIFSRPGFEDSVLRRSFAPGRSVREQIVLTELPATLRISSNLTGSLVRVGASDVGPAPVDVLRPAGSYRVVVQRPGFLSYEAQVDVRAGQETTIRAKLTEDRPSLFKRWWFWTGAAVVVAGAAIATYAFTRPDHREEVGAGSLGWSANVP